MVDHKTKEWVIGYLKGGNLKDIDVDELVTGIIDIVTATITTATIDNLDVTTNLDINGSLDFKTVTKTADYTAGNEVIIRCDASNNDITITLPAVAIHTGRVYHIKKIDSSAHTVTIDGTIDGESSQIITTQNVSLFICSNGSSYDIH